MVDAVQSGGWSPEYSSDDLDQKLVGIGLPVSGADPAYLSI
jgi:hypothetical protein